MSTAGTQYVYFCPVQKTCIQRTEMYVVSTCPIVLISGEFVLQVQCSLRIGPLAVWVFASWLVKLWTCHAIFIV